MPEDKQWYIDQYGTTMLNGEEHYLEDGDTWKNLATGETFRAKGFDTEEVYHDADQPTKAPGTVTGYAQTEVVADAMREQGFDTQTSEGFGFYGRTLGNVKHRETGEELSARLLSENIVTPNAYTSEEGLDAYIKGNRVRRHTEDKDSYWAKQRSFVNDVKDNYDLFVPKLTALDEAEYKSTPGLYSGVEFRHYDRDLNNQAYSPFKSGIRQGLLGIQQSYYGAKALVGDTLDNEELYNAGMRGIHDINLKSADMPEYVRNYKEVHSASDAIDYVAGQAGTALPYMLGIIASYGTGSVLASTQAAKYALGTAAPSLIYSGEVYSNMEGEKDEKSASAALLAGVAMASLDVLGVALLFKPSHLMTKYGKHKVALEYIKQNPGTRLEDALNYIESILQKNAFATYDSLATLSAVALGKEGLGKLAQNTLLNTGKGALSEGITEVAQEGLGYATSVFGSNKEWDPAQFEDIVINAGIGGATLGGGFGTVSGAAGGYRDFKNVVRQTTGVERSASEGVEVYNEEVQQIEASLEAVKKQQDKAPKADKADFDPLIQQYEIDLARAKEDKGTRMHTVTSLIKQESGKVSEGPLRESLNKELEATKDDDLRKNKGWATFFKELPRRTIDSAADFVQHRLMNNFKGHSSALQSIEKAILGLVNTGISYASGAHLALERLRVSNEYTTQSSGIYNNIMSVFKTRHPTVLSKGNFSSVMKDMETFHNAYNKGTSDSKLQEMFPDINITEAKKVSASINIFISKFQAKINSKLERGEFNTKKAIFDMSKDWFWEATELNIDAVAKNKARFISKATSILGSKLKAEQAYEASFAVVNNFDPTRKRLGLGDNKFTPFEMRRVDEEVVKDVVLLVKDPEMNEFLHTDFEAQSAQKISRITKYATDIEYKGENDITLAKLLHAYKVRAMKEEVYDPRVLHHIVGLLDAMDGNYKPIESDAIANAQENITMINGLNQLESAALPSLVEFVTAFFRTAGTGNTSDLIRKAVRDGIVPLFKNNIKETVKYFIKGSGMTLQEHQRNVGAFYESGQASHEGGVMAKLDVEPASKIKAGIMKAFFSVTLLKHVTDFSRITRWALANDAIIQDIEIVSLYWNERGSNTAFVNDAYDRLRDLRVDPVQLAKDWKAIAADPNIALIYKAHRDKGALDEKARSEIDEALFIHIKNNYPELQNQLSLARQSYVEMGTVRPDTTTKPLWALNPRYRLLTQYTSYIMAFQSQALPKIWKDVKGANPDVQYATFQMMMYMLLVAYLGQELKDLWKFGEENPYLSQGKKNYRAGMQSGLLGSLHRPLELLAPVYSSSSDKGDYTFSKFKQDVKSRGKAIAGPTASTATDLYDALSATIEGEDDKAAYRWKRMVPIFGGTREYTGKPPY